ncbi:MAG: hypothetical protein SFZ24_02800 [Planctomycetota bacterium]|nr:hypothetical protein [Planctomycetota bacterium]
MTTPSAKPALQPLVISAPFGNYIQPAGCTPTLGTFTAARRPGRLWRILRTVRYYPRLGAWVNKIGLRNPGIDWLVRRAAQAPETVRDKLVSIHGFCDDDWWTLLDKAAALKPLGIELNMSCPNVGHVNWPDSLFDRAVATGVPIVVKLPPVNYREMFQSALQAGVRAFHCCNTIPVPAGGVSGKPLKPVAIQCILDVRTIAARHADAPARTQPHTADPSSPIPAPAPAPGVLIIGGGGITTPQDVDDYASAGADVFAVGTKVFNPAYLLSHSGLNDVLARARHHAGAASTPR